MSSRASAGRTLSLAATALGGVWLTQDRLDDWKYPCARCLRVENEIKLDFKDVLIRPKRSTLRSRSEVSLERTLLMKHSGRELSCTPLIVANMDTVGTFEMAVALAPFGTLVAVHKHYSLEEWKKFVASHPGIAEKNILVSSGTSAADLAKLDAILLQCPKVTAICLDVANGYSESFVEAASLVHQCHFFLP